MKLTELRNRKFFVSEALLAIFVVFTLLIKVIDVKAIGPEGSKVGFAAINGAFAKILPYNAVFYTIAEILGVFILLVVAAFALAGAYQLIQGRSIKAVDDKIIILGVYYVIVFILYILFDKVALNYRPVIIDAAEGLEPSYPSSHTMLAVCVVGTAMMLVDNYIRNEKYAKIAKIVLIAAGSLTVISRFLSGAHWFTDIIGALIISAALVTLYGTIIKDIEGSAQQHGKHEIKKGRH